MEESPVSLTNEQAAWAEATLAGLSTEEKAGRLFCVMGGDDAPEKL